MAKLGGDNRASEVPVLFLISITKSSRVLFCADILRVCFSPPLVCIKDSGKRYTAAFEPVVVELRCRWHTAYERYTWQFCTLVHYCAHDIASISSAQTCQHRDAQAVSTRHPSHSCLIKTCCCLELPFSRYQPLLSACCQLSW